MKVVKVADSVGTAPVIERTVAAVEVERIEVAVG